MMRGADRSGRLKERDEESTMKGKNNIGWYLLFIEKLSGAIHCTYRSCLSVTIADISS